MSSRSQSIRAMASTWESATEERDRATVMYGRPDLPKSIGLRSTAHVLLVGGRGSGTYGSGKYENCSRSGLLVRELLTQRIVGTETAHAADCWYGNCSRERIVGTGTAPQSGLSGTSVRQRLSTTFNDFSFWHYYPMI